MPSVIRCLLPVLLVSFAVPTAARAQEDLPPLDPARVPATGARVQSFVPNGWKVAHQISGDLNGDGRADQVVHMVPTSSDWYDPDGVSAAPAAQALVVLLAGADGRLRRGGVATRLLQPSVPQWGLQLSIRNGVLVVNQNYGMTDVTDATHRFRWDAAARRFVLIGRDRFNYHRPQEMTDPVKRSENYLTGVRLVTTGHYAANGRYSETERRERIPRTHVAMESVDELDQD
ncbi:MAG TPA: hypothetical protein VFJ16_18655 [Longimicrobium sp.]|nr:hypothetical protein [Longimicrobium sp.]